LQLLDVIAENDYRVVGLEYNDSPAAVQVCPRNPRSDCSARFRQKKNFFRNDVLSEVDKTPVESNAHRRENTEPLIRRASILRPIPRTAHRKNPFHSSTIRVCAYAPEWSVLLDRSL